MRIKLDNLDATRDFAIKVANLVKDRSGSIIIFLRGDLGTGKTTFSQFFAEEFKTSAKSPTFGLVNIYEGIRDIYHLDLYRLSSYEEAINIGIEEILDSDSIKLIEWPEIIEDEFHDADIIFERNGNQRFVNFSGDLFKGSEIC